MAGGGLMPRPARRGPTTLEGAFRVLGAAPTYRELRFVRDALFASGSEEAVELLYAAADPRGGGFDELVAVAERNGSSAFVALDLVSEPVEAAERVSEA
jgi:hypothetical protein